jgi:glycosyltransferase involved in cell wall biosynthesis
MSMTRTNTISNDFNNRFDSESSMLNDPDDQIYEGDEFKQRFKRLIIDVSLLHQYDAGTGIQRVVRNVWNALNALSGDFQLVPIFAQRDGNFYIADNDFLSIKVKGEPAFNRAFSPRPGDVFLGLDFSPVLLPRCKRAIDRWRQLGIPIYVVVYDLLPYVHPQWFTRRGVRNYRRWLSLLESRIDGALCISNSVKTELSHVLEHRGRMRFWKRAPHIDIKHIRLGTDFRSGASQPVPLMEPALLSGRPIILMVGTIEPRKGYDFALEVFEDLWASSKLDPIIVIVGKTGWKARSLREILENHPRLGTSLFWLADVDDAQLAWLYESSTVFFSASNAEGFGLPLAEAQSYGLPVVATDLPVFREFESHDIRFFPAGVASEAARALSAAVVQASLARDERQEINLRPVFRPTWTDTAKDILGCIGELSCAQQLP